MSKIDAFIKEAKAGGASDADIANLLADRGFFDQAKDVEGGLPAVMGVLGLKHPLGPYGLYYDRLGKKYGVEPRLLAAQGKQESGWRPDAEGEEITLPSGEKARARGIAQLMPGTAKEFGVDPLDPEAAIDAQAQIMARNLKKHNGDYSLALKEYFGGPSTARWGPKTEQYPQDVEKHLKLFDEAYGPPVGGVDTKTPTRLATFTNNYTLGAAIPAASAGAAAKEAYREVKSGKPLAEATGNAIVNYQENKKFFNDLTKLAESQDPTGQTVAAVAGQAVPLLAGGLAANSLLKSAGAANPAIAPVTNFLRGAPEAGGIGTKIAASATQGGLQGALAGIETLGLTDEPAGKHIATNELIGSVANPLIGGASTLLRKPISYFAEKYLPAGETKLNELAHKALGDINAGQPLTINTNQIVPGARPTLAEATGNANVAAAQRLLEQRNPEPFYTLARDNAKARADYLTSATGTRPDLVEAMAARKAITTDELWKGAGPVDLRPVQGKIDEILSGPTGVDPGVKSNLKEVSKLLKDDAGLFRQDAETAYRGILTAINKRLDTNTFSTPASRQAAAELIDVKKELQKQIGAATPGFNEFLSEYSVAAQKVDALKFLQGLNLIDASGATSLGKINGAIRKIEENTLKPGPQKAKAVTDDQLDTLRTLRDDLVRQEQFGSISARDIAALGDRMSLPFVHAGALAGSSVGAPTAGAVAGGIVGSAFGRYSKSKSAQVENALVGLMTNPDKVDEAMLLRLMTPPERRKLGRLVGTLGADVGRNELMEK